MKHVKIDDRTFIVTFDGDAVRVIKERKLYAPGTPYEALFDAPYWHRSAKMPTRGIVPRIIAAARSAAQ